jgi:hypothetical protein
MKVFVYFNLHRKLFSVKALEGPNKGKVISHTTYLWLKDVTFKVSEAGRQRVLREKRKNVHAGVVGTLDCDLSNQDYRNFGFSLLKHNSTQVTYNPYRFSSFVNKETSEPVKHAQYCLLNAVNGRTGISACGVTA